MKKYNIKACEAALKKYQVAKEKKRDCLVKLEEQMRRNYKQRTGKDAESFFAL